MARMLKRNRAEKTYRLYFVRAAAVLPTKADEVRADFKANHWYDGVSQAHKDAVGDAALEITLDLECGCLLLPDGRTVVTRTVDVPDRDKDTGQEIMRPEVTVSLKPHAEACAFEQEEE